MSGVVYPHSPISTTGQPVVTSPVPPLDFFILNLSQHYALDNKTEVKGSRKEGKGEHKGQTQPALHTTQAMCDGRLVQGPSERLQEQHTAASGNSAGGSSGLKDMTLKTNAVI